MVCARTAFTWGAASKVVTMRIGDLVFDDIGRLTRPFRVNDHLHIADVGQGVRGYG